MPIPLAIPLVMGGLGAVSNMIGAGEQAKAARQLTALTRELPKAEMSKFAQQRIAESRSAMQQNPLMQAMQRGIATQQANTLFRARQAARPDQYLQFVAGAGEQAQDAITKGLIEAQGLEEARRQAYYASLAGGQQAEQDLFENIMGGLQARANIITGAAGMKQAAAQGVGQGLMGLASSMFASGNVGGLGKAASATKGLTAGQKGALANLRFF